VQNTCEDWRVYMAPELEKARSLCSVLYESHCDVAMGMQG
jgi:hypothetical protein